jgi:4-hydroxy-tetrahydrodipicolinate synthase
VAQACDLPLIVYNIPGRTASNILPSTLAQLAQLDNIVGVKESCGDLDQIAHVVAQCPDDFAVLSGDDALTLPLMSVGGDGVISTSANVAPRDMLELVHAFAVGDAPLALAVHQRLLPLFDALFCETNPIPLKAALAIMGLCSEEIRLPLTAITQPNREALQVVLKELGFA